MRRLITFGLVAWSLLAITSAIAAENKSNPIISVGGKDELVLRRFSLDRILTYQGLLKNSSGEPVPDASYNLTFRIYNRASGGSALWTSSSIPVTTSSGYFTTQIGSVPLPFDTTYYLSLQVQSDPEMTNRQKLTLSPYSASSDTANYSFKSDTALFALGGNAGGWVDNGTVVRLATSSDSVGIGTATPSQKLHVEGNLYVSGKATIGSPNINTANWTFVSGTGDTVTADYSVVQGYGNAASGSRATVSGGSGNKANANYATVSGGTGNQATGTSSTVGGGWSNTTTAQRATVSGGHSNYAGGDEGTVGGGYADTAKAVYGGIASGYHNVAGDAAEDTGALVGGGYNNRAYAPYSTVVGGYSSSANSYYSAVVGGQYNNAESTCSFIGGGYSNHATSGSAICGGWNNDAFGNSFLGGGFQNSATGVNSTVGAGNSNTAAGDYSVIAGGRSNSAPAPYASVVGGRVNNAGTEVADTGAFVGGGYNNDVASHYGTIAGGYANLVNHDYASIGGGNNNQAMGNYSAVAGGRINVAGGYCSFVGGGEDNYALGLASCIPGGTADTVSSTGDRSMAFGYGVYVQGSNIVVFFDGNSSGTFALNRDSRDGSLNYPLMVGTNSGNGNGAYLSYGGIWANGSSRTFKENFTPFNSDELLRKISNLSITTWNYKNSTEKHVGPVAEEFVGAFDTGVIRESDGKRDDQYLSSGDVAGVALAGVQELIKENDELKKENADMKKMLNDFERRLSELEKR